MSSLEEIQQAIVSGGPIGPVLLRLRLLSSKLGSAPLEEWVRHEAEGYPKGVELPEYRIHGLSFTGTFFGPFGSGLKNAPIPPYLVGQIAGENWQHYKVRYSAAAVDSVVEKGEGLTLDLANLALLLEGQIYEDMSCNQLKGYVSHAAFVEVSNAIRNRTLELTIGLEKAFPEAFAGNSITAPADTNQVTKVFEQTVYGDVNYIQNSGSDQVINLSISKQDNNLMLSELKKAGLIDSEAKELAMVISEESPSKTEDGEVKFGKKLRQWLGERVTNGVDSGVKGGVTALVKIAEEAAKQYWNLK